MMIIVSSLLPCNQDFTSSLLHKIWSIVYFAMNCKMEEGWAILGVMYPLWFYFYFYFLVFSCIASFAGLATFI